MFHKPYSASCDQNRQAIFEVIQPLFKDCTEVLEIGSGTGQHAVYFGTDLAHLQWQTSDVVDNHAGIECWLAEYALSNVLPPLALDVLCDPWPRRTYDAIFSANTLHIMSKAAVSALFEQLPCVLNPQTKLAIYGPFNYEGKYTSESNARFDQWLHERDPNSGIKAFEWVNQLAQQAGLTLINDVAMPANNRTLCWQVAPNGT